MFGSRAVARAVQEALAGTAAVTATVGTSIHNRRRVPQGGALPAVLHYGEMGRYDGAIGGAPNAETMRWVVRVLCKGASSAPIITAAEAMVTKLDGLTVTVGDDSVTLNANAEYLPADLFEGGDEYTQLGIYLDAHVMR